MLNSLKEMNGTRMTGLMLLAGIAVIFLSGIFSPGVLIIDMATGVEPADVEDAIRAKVDNSHATTITASFYLIGHFLLLGGILGLWPRERGGSGGDAVVRAGIMTIIVAFIAGIASAVLDFAIVLGDRHGRSAGVPLEEYWPSVQSFHYFDAGVQGMLLFATFAGHALLACGLARRLAGRRRMIAKATGLISFAALVLLLIGVQAEGAEVLAAIAGIGIFVITAWMLLLGRWVYTEDSELLGA